MVAFAPSSAARIVASSRGLPAPKDDISQIAQETSEGEAHDPARAPSIHTLIFDDACSDSQAARMRHLDYGGMFIRQLVLRGIRWPNLPLQFSSNALVRREPFIQGPDSGPEDSDANLRGQGLAHRLVQSNQALSPAAATAERERAIRSHFGSSLSPLWEPGCHPGDLVGGLRPPAATLGLSEALQGRFPKVPPCNWYLGVLALVGDRLFPGSPW